MLWAILLAAIPLTGDLAAEVPLACLVRSKVKSVTEEKKGLVTAKLEVTRVYSGPAELVGDMFSDEARPNGDFHGFAAETAFEVGEEGIWTLWKSKMEALQVPRIRNGSSGWQFYARSRKGDLRHAKIELMSVAVEKVEKEKPEKRLALLRNFVTDKTYEVAYWAMTAIGSSDSADAKKYLNELAAKPDAKLAVAALIALDEILCKLTESDWTDSKPRSEMLRTWVSGKKDQHDAGRILSRLYNAHQDHNLADKLAVELWRTAAENKEWPLDTRKYAIWRMDFVVKFSANDEARFAAIDWVYEQMRSNDTIELRRAAADTLSQLPLYPKRLKAIEEHLTTEKDERVAEALRAAIKKVRENDK